MPRLLAVVLSLLVFFQHPASAQQPTYTSEDAGILQECFETVRDINSDPEAEPLTTLHECIGAASGICQEAPEGQTTIGMVECALRETAWWDEQLNYYYASLRESLDPALFAGLRDAQRAWIAYRDADCRFHYDYWQGGTIQGIFHASCMLDRTAVRAIDLAQMLDW